MGRERHAPCALLLSACVSLACRTTAPQAPPAAPSSPAAPAPAAAASPATPPPAPPVEAPAPPTPSTEDGKIVGVVTWVEDGQPAPGVYVSATRTESQQDPLPFVTTDDNGRYELTGLPAGTYE